MFMSTYKSIFRKRKGTCPSCLKENTLYYKKGQIGYRTKYIEIPLPVKVIMNRHDCRFLDIYKSFKNVDTFGVKERAEDILEILHKTTLPDKEEIEKKMKMMIVSKKISGPDWVQDLDERIASDWYCDRIYKYFTLG